MLKGTIAVVTIFWIISLGTSVQAAGDAAAGKAKSAMCAGCHGVDGRSQVPMYPNLAGQKEQYLAKAMAAYKNGSRNDPVMQPMVASLTEADIQNLAAYYAGLSCK